MSVSVHRSGFIGIVGRPNVGKSTIMNQLLGEKISIVSPLPQTTRHRILGVLTLPHAQLLFLDSPGLHRSEDALGRSMVQAVTSVLSEADILLVVIDARKGITMEDERVFDRVRLALHQPIRAGKRVSIAAINKVDLVKKPKILPLIEACAKTGIFAECIPISATTEVQIPLLLERLIAYLPEGPQWYEPKDRTDQTITQRVGELIREQILLATRQEVPYAVAVSVDKLEEQPQISRIEATLFVERQGQKAILIGRGGLLLKRIGESARKQIEPLVGRKIYLGLWVKVEKDWRSDKRFVERLGYGAQLS
ncbi:MAG: GTPase Era [Candidatus Omnitrophica bacterium]|nr:GTPase Era [Candidatus Omnitrophota bacterium]